MHADTVSGVLHGDSESGNIDAFYRKEQRNVHRESDNNGKVLAITCACAMFSCQAWAQQTIDVVEVVGQTPLGAGIDIDDIAANVQSASADYLRRQRALDLTDYMKRSFAGVFVNEAQSNPLQPDVQYRGFVGSPLLGLPQGLAVYVDGVRVNEVFGDTVNWALIPESAIDTAHLMPGSNPLFGLNALGGAISIHTKNGRSHAGTSAELSTGSFGRFGIEAESGGMLGADVDWFLTASHLREDGWRDYSPTDASALFGKIGWHSDTTTVDFSASFADTRLLGNGAAPVDLLQQDRSAIYTHPDETRNDLQQFNLRVARTVSDSLTLAANVYLRDSDIATYNGDEADFKECLANPGYLCETDDSVEELLLDANDSPIPADPQLMGGTIGRTDTRQSVSGFSLQAAWKHTVWQRENLFVLGASLDDGEVEFASSSELGQLDDTRLAVPGGVYLGDAFTRLITHTRSNGIYLTDTLALTDSLSLTVSGRFNSIDVVLRDRLGTVLNGNHKFKRFNPALGMSAKLTGNLTYYLGYSESNRAPSPVELTCADEDDPCRLPNAFLADPPLQQVLARTYETGIRGVFGGGSWHAGLFRTDSDDDIQFISAGALSNEGYFDNVGRTRRQGLELSFDTETGDSLRWFVAYSFLDAHYSDNLVLPSRNNPVAIDGEIVVSRGDRLPLIPRHLLKAGWELTLGERFSLGGDLAAASDFYLRGDEGNDVAPLGEYLVLNLRSEFRISDRLVMFLDIDNVLDHEYETFGLFGDAEEVLGDEYDDPRFLSPAAPRGAWLGVRLTL